MISLQILNKILQTKDISLIVENQLTAEFFTGYEAEYEFIVNHHKKYDVVPDVLSYLDKFKDAEVFDVTESDSFLVKGIREEYLYNQVVPIIEKAAEFLKADSNDAVEYLLHAMKGVTPNYEITGVDIVKNAGERLKVFNEHTNDKWYITTGFPELDDIVHGWAKGEELVIIFARTGQKKSWFLTKSLVHAWETGNRVGYISPEMSGIKIGYRFDTTLRNFSNTALTWAKRDKLNIDEYSQYIQELEQKEGFIVATPEDFNRKITISKLRQFVLQNKLDILGIDGISYMTDERYSRGDNKTTSLTNISEDLIQLSIELGIPILAVMQSNRGGVRDDAPELEDAKDSDGPVQNATKVLTLKQMEGGFQVVVRKQRDGIMGVKLLYNWDVDIGQIAWIPTEEDDTPRARAETEETKQKFEPRKNKKNPF